MLDLAKCIHFNINVPFIHIYALKSFYLAARETLLCYTLKFYILKKEI